MKKINVREIVVFGICAALSVVLIYLIRIPLFYDFLEYDPGDIPIFLCSYLYGSVGGLAVTLVASVIQGLTVSAQSGWIGIIMHILATGSYVLVSGMILKKQESTKRLVVASVAGILTMTVLMAFWNLVFTPMFTGMKVSVVVGMLPFIILFNLIKATVNTIFSIVIYKSIYKIVKIA